MDRTTYLTNTMSSTELIPYQSTYLTNTMYSTDIVINQMNDIPALAESLKLLVWAWLVLDGRPSGNT